MGPDPKSNTPVLQHSITPGGAVRLEGKVAIVTGGARHIGSAYCVKFAAEGAAVAIADILDGQFVANEIRSKGGKAIALKIDVSNENRSEERRVGKECRS